MSTFKFNSFMAFIFSPIIFDFFIVFFRIILRSLILTIFVFFIMMKIIRFITTIFIMPLLCPELEELFKSKFIFSLELKAELEAVLLE